MRRPLICFGYNLVSVVVIKAPLGRWLDVRPRWRPELSPIPGTYLAEAIAQDPDAAKSNVIAAVLPVDASLPDAAVTLGYARIRAALQPSDRELIHTVAGGGPFGVMDYHLETLAARTWDTGYPVRLVAVDGWGQPRALNTLPALLREWVTDGPHPEIERAPRTVVPA